jgi:hypothetical protein
MKIGRTRITRNTDGSTTRTTALFKNCYDVQRTPAFKVPRSPGFKAPRPPGFKATRLSREGDAGAAIVVLLLVGLIQARLALFRGLFGSAAGPEQEQTTLGIIPTHSEAIAKVEEEYGSWIAAVWIRVQAAGFPVRHYRLMVLNPNTWLPNVKFFLLTNEEWGPFIQKAVSRAIQGGDTSPTGLASLVQCDWTIDHEDNLCFRGERSSTWEERNHGEWTFGEGEPPDGPVASEGHSCGSAPENTDAAPLEAIYQPEPEPEPEPEPKSREYRPQPRCDVRPPRKCKFPSQPMKVMCPESRAPCLRPYWDWEQPSATECFNNPHSCECRRCSLWRREQNGLGRESVHDHVTCDCRHCKRWREWTTGDYTEDGEHSDEHDWRTVPWPNFPSSTAWCTTYDPEIHGVITRRIDEG